MPYIIIFGSLPEPNSVHFLPNITIPQVATFDLYVCIQLFTHQKCYLHINSHIKQLKFLIQ